jgi:hypothetical protein
VQEDADCRDGLAREGVGRSGEGVSAGRAGGIGVLPQSIGENGYLSGMMAVITLVLDNLYGNYLIESPILILIEARIKYVAFKLHSASI